MRRESALLSPTTNRTSPMPRPQKQVCNSKGYPMHSVWKTWFMAAACGCGVLLTATVLSPSGAGANRLHNRAAKVSKQFLAFYYGWYGNPDVSQHWSHWRNVDTARKHIDQSTHY